jgi:hypothetical protein
MSASEASHFKSYLRLKRNGQKSKKVSLFLLMLAGHENDYIKNQLYSEKQSVSAYYHLRKDLLEDLENFLVLEHRKINKKAQLMHYMILAQRAFQKGHSNLASHYYDTVIAGSGIEDETTLLMAQYNKKFLDEKHIENLHKQFTKDVLTFSIDYILSKYTLHFFTFLRKKDVLPFINSLKTYEIDEKQGNKYCKLLFLKSYGLCLINNYVDAIDIANILYKKCLFDNEILITTHIWAILLKMHVFSKMGELNQANEQLKKLETNFYNHVGSQYQLLILRWGLVMHIHNNNFGRATDLIMRILQEKTSLAEQIGEKQTLKLLTFIAGFATHYNNQELKDKLTSVCRDVFPYIEAVHEDLSPNSLVEAVWMEEFDSYEPPSMSLKTPENILYQHTKLKDWTKKHLDIES